MKSRNYIVTSSLLSLQAFAKMEIISFSLESRPNLYLPLYCLVQYHPFKSILSFSKCMSRTNETFRGNSGPRTEFLRYLDSLPGKYSFKCTVSHIGMCHPQNKIRPGVKEQGGSNPHQEIPGAPLPRPLKRFSSSGK